MADWRDRPLADGKPDLRIGNGQGATLLRWMRDLEAKHTLQANTERGERLLGAMLARESDETVDSTVD